MNLRFPEFGARRMSKALERFGIHFGLVWFRLDDGVDGNRGYPPEAKNQPWCAVKAEVPS